MRKEAAELRSDIDEVQALTDRLRRWYLDRTDRMQLTNGHTPG